MLSSLILILKFYLHIQTLDIIYIQILWKLLPFKIGKRNILCTPTVTVQYLAGSPPANCLLQLANRSTGSQFIHFFYLQFHNKISNQKAPTWKNITAMDQGINVCEDHSMDFSNHDISILHGNHTQVCVWCASCGVRHGSLSS